MQRFTLIIFVSALAFSSPGLAGATEAVRQVTVSLADIDTSTERGADHALRRIRQAAENVCDARNGPQPNGERTRARACSREAMARAIADLNNPTVSARFLAATQVAEDRRERGAGS